MIRGLLALRALPAGLSRHPGWRPARPGPLTLAEVLAGGFALIGEVPGREIVLGVEGRFWAPMGGLCATDVERFRAPVEPGLARAAWNFTVEDEGTGRSRLATETRILCGDSGARRRFGLYWILVRPGSGLIRRAMLRAIRRQAET